jgi:hypothetical protein
MNILPMRPSWTCLPTSGAVVLLLCGCQRDQIAPDCFLRVSGECVVIEDVEIPGEVSLECGKPPLGALEAFYSYTVDYQAADPTFSATDLPPGLTIGSSGEISGVPTMEGTFMPKVTLTDLESGATADSECGPITIGPALTHDVFDLPPTAPLGCLPVGEKLEDHIQGGDKSPITCTPPQAADPPSTSCPFGDGNGLVPAGVTFNAGDCSYSGAPTEEQHGTWVWMVKAEQSGYELWVPFCASKDAAPFHNIGIRFGMNSHDPMAPFIVPFVPADPLVFGGGMEDPVFEITSACGGGSCNNWGYEFSAMCSPFNTPFSFQPDNSLDGMMGQKIGFSHEMTASTQGDPVDNPTKDGDAGERTWVANFRMWYCTSGNNMDCDTDLPGFQDNAQTRYTMSIIAHPQ